MMVATDKQRAIFQSPETEDTAGDQAGWVCYWRSQFEPDWERMQRVERAQFEQMPGSD